MVQNGATSIVGQCVIQLAKLRGMSTINVIRDRLIYIMNLNFKITVYEQTEGALVK